MRAISYSSFGPANDVLELGQVETPTPGAGEVLVRLAFSGVNPSDAKARAGGRPGVTKPAFPRIIPHSDGSGVIEAVGTGVDAARIGEKVWIWNGQWQRAFGTAADYIALPGAQAVPLPDDVSLETGATLGIPGLTAAHTVFGGGDVAGQTLLISGGAGAVGYNAVQLAKWGGARVIATASASARARVENAGADLVFEYSDPDLGDKIIAATDGAGVSRAIEVEFGENAGLLAQVMAENGTIAAYGSAKSMEPALPFGLFLFKALKIDISLIYILPDALRETAIDLLHGALSGGALKPGLQATYAMSDCAAAHGAVMTPGRKGAVLLDMS